MVTLAQRTKETGQVVSTSVYELVAYCPKCKTLETLWFTRNGLMETQKFSQHDDQIYHDCGSNEPCRMYRAS